MVYGLQNTKSGSQLLEVIYEDCKTQDVRKFCSNFKGSFRAYLQDLKLTVLI